MKKFFILTLTSIVLATSLIAPNFVSAKAVKLDKPSINVSQEVITASQEKVLREKFTKQNILPAVQDSLIQKIKEGKMIDSLNPQMQKSMPKNFFKADKNQPYKRYVFPDGSVAESKIEVLSKKPALNKIGQVTPDGVSDGSGYQYYYDIKISVDFGVISGSFIADFCLNQDAYDEIDDVRYPDVFSAIGSYSNVKLGITRKYESYYQDAQAYLSWDNGILIKGLIGESTCYVWLNVGNDSYSTTHN